MPAQPAGSGSLINRVRTGERRQPPPIQPTPQSEPRRNEPSPTPQSPAPQRESVPTPPAPSGPDGLSLESIRNKWGQVKADVSAVNVRTGALMSEMDPAALEGTKLILTVPYPFHADKMNSDETRPIVEQILTRVMGTPLTLECFTTEAFRERPVRTETSASAPAAVPATAEPAEVTPPMSAEPEDVIDPTESLRALRNIFDAEEIEPNDD